MEVSATEVKIRKFLGSYGAETLISWLARFDVIFSAGEYPLYKRLEKEACKACGITHADMLRNSDVRCCNARKIISFIAFNELKLCSAAIANLLGFAERSITNYIKDAEGWIESPRSNKEFFEAYSQVIEKFKTK